jgi:hypothetical protein
MGYRNAKSSLKGLILFLMHFTDSVQNAVNKTHHLFFLLPEVSRRWGPLLWKAMLSVQYVSLITALHATP